MFSSRERGGHVQCALQRGPQRGVFRRGPSDRHQAFEQLLLGPQAGFSPLTFRDVVQDDQPPNGTVMDVADGGDTQFIGALLDTFPQGDFGLDLMHVPIALDQVISIAQNLGYRLADRLGGRASDDLPRGRVDVYNSALRVQHKHPLAHTVYDRAARDGHNIEQPETEYAPGDDQAGHGECVWGQI